MGNIKSKEESTTPTTTTTKKKEKQQQNGFSKSISLRSLVSLGGGKKEGGRGKHATAAAAEKMNNNKNIEENYEDTNLSAYTESYVDQINQSVFAPQINSIFCPEFAFRSDICSSDFKYLSKLGEGTFSTVYRATCLTKKNTIVAIKVQNKSIILNKGAAKQIKRESDIHKSVSNSIFIACYFDCWQTSNHLFTVMECVDGFGDLYSLWKENKLFSEDSIRIYSAEIGSLLDYLKINKVVYRDFKMENLALDYRKHIKLIDFGFARRLLNVDEKDTTICGTLQYMAPEVAKEQYYGFEVDWWSFGIVLYVLSEDEYPYPNNHAKIHSELVYDSEITFSQTSEALKELIIKLLNKNPNQRLSILNDLKKLKFFPKNFDFDNLNNYEIDINEIKQTTTILPDDEKKSKTNNTFNLFQW